MALPLSAKTLFSAKRLRRALTATLLLSLSCTVSAADLVDRIVAVVGDDVVMLSELRSKAQEIFGELRRKKVSPMPGRDQIVKQALDDLISNKLQLTEAERLGIDVDTDTVNEAIGRIAENNHMTLAQFREALQSEGLPFSAFQQRIREQIVRARLINQAVTNRIQVSKSEVDQELARVEATPAGRGEVHLLHIVMITPDGASAAQIDRARQRAQNAYKRIEGGESFRAVAQATSDGSKSINGGDIGWLSIGQLPRAFGSYLAKMQPGETAGPFQSSNGFHIIKVEGFRGQDGQRSIIRQTKTRHILIKTDEITSASEAQERLLQLRDRIIHGADFAELARANSSDKGSAIKGGDLGWVSPGVMVPAFEEVMNNTEAGSISQPFKSQFGWHILEVQERRVHDATEQAKRNAARKTIRDRKSKESSEQYLRRLRDEAFVELKLDE